MFCFRAVSYSAWKVNGCPAQFVMDVFMKPLRALAVMYPVCPVVISRTVAVSPDGGSERDASSTSPGFSFSVRRLPRKLATVAVCGPGGPAGTPLVCR